MFVGEVDTHRYTPSPEYAETFFRGINRNYPSYLQRRETKCMGNAGGGERDFSPYPILYSDSDVNPFT